MFWCQLLTDLCRSKQKINYLKTHWLDFIASIPIIEPVRYIRILQIFRVLRLIRSSQQVLAHIRSNRREATIATIFLLITVLVTVGSALILILEGNDPNSNIHSATDAIWWVFVTISTVGYGDHYPVTLAGKLLAAVIIFCGVGLFGMVAGLVSSVITDPQKQKETNEKKRKKEWQQMLETQTRLIERLENLESRLNDNTSPEYPEKHKK
jgi:voltage-gated potassium channel